MSEEGGKVLPFRRREEIPAEVMHVEWVRAEGVNLMTECTGGIHVFDAVPGTCKCGENFWDPQAPEPVVSA